MEARGANRTPPKAKHLLGTRRAIRTQLYPVIFFSLGKSFYKAVQPTRIKAGFSFYSPIFLGSKYTSCL